MDATLQSNNFLLPSNVQHSLHAQLAGMYSDLQSRHNAQKIEMIEYKSKANYWEAQFTQLKTRENELTNEVEELKAKLR